MEKPNDQKLQQTWIIRPQYIFHMPKKMHPDQLLLTFLHSTGEFSVAADEAFEKQLEWKHQYKLRQLQYA